MKKFAFILCALLALQPALACKMAAESYDLGAFLKSREPSRVVFLATVESVKALPAEDGVAWQKIHFKASRWWVGTPSTDVEGLASRRLVKTHDCSMVHNFSVKKGEQWLLAGTLEDGKVRPSALLSVLLKNGKIPHEVLETLEKNQAPK